MYKLIKNSYESLNISDNSQIVDLFDWFSGKKQVVVDKDCKLKYLVLVKDADVDIEVLTWWEGSDLKVFVMILPSSQSVKCSIKTDIEHSDVVLDKYILSILGDEAKVYVDGIINILKPVKNVKAHLLEENLILWKNVSIRTLPVLNIACKDVKASHGAKIEKISQDKLFYMNARWMSLAQSQKLFVDSYVVSMFNDFDEIEIQQKEYLVGWINSSLDIVTK